MRWVYRGWVYRVRMKICGERVKMCGERVQSMTVD